jgi:hypothetical protein
VTLDKQTGRSVTAGSKNQTVDIFPSWYTAMSSTGGKNAQVDKLSGKLATDCTPPLARDTVYSSAVQPEITKAENPSQYQLWLVALQKAGYSTSGGDLPTESDDKHNCSDEKPAVSIVGANGGGPYNFNVQVTSGRFTANKLQVYFDDQIISTQDINGSGNYPVTCSTACANPGSHIFKALVTDAGYYQGQDEQTVTVTNTGGGGTSSTFFGATPADGAQVSPGPVTFAWSAASGASLYTLYVDGVARGTSVGNARTVNGLGNGNHTWYVKADTNDTTDTLTFRIH